MANMRVINATGALDFTTNANWDSSVNTYTLHASTNITVSTTNLFTATFTAPNTSNKCTGVLIYAVTSPGSATTWKATLQESTVDTSATATIATSLFSLQTQLVYFRFATPYQFTTTGAGAYRFKIVASSSSNAGLAAADSGGSNIAYIAIMDNNVFPGTGDDCIIQAPNNTGTTTVTYVGSAGNYGSGADTTVIYISRSFGMAMMVGAGGLLRFDTTASTSITIKGTVGVLYNGEWDIGTLGSPYPSSYTATVNMNQNGVAGNYGICTFSNAVVSASSLGGKLSFVGAAKTYWKTSYVSGNGTTATPLVTGDSTGWTINDQVTITATGNDAANYNETETMFIKTISGTSITLSAVAGGAETALTYTHDTDAVIYNLTRNIVFTSPSTTQGTYLCHSSSAGIGSIISWTRWEYVGANGTGKLGIMYTISNPASECTSDYNIAYKPQQSGHTWQSSTAFATHTGLLTIGLVINNYGGIFPFSCSNKTLVDCVALNSTGVGWYLDAATNCTFTRPVAISNNTANGGKGGFYFLSNSVNCTITDAEIHCNRGEGIYLGAQAAISFINCNIGTKGYNQTYDINVTTSAYTSVTFYNCIFASPTMIFGANTAAAGSLIVFSKNNNVNYENLWYTSYGLAQTTGAGLADTNVRTAGTYNVRISSVDATTGFTWSYYKPVPVGEAISALGFIQLNAAFTGDSGASCVINLFLPGNQLIGATPDYTYTMPKTDNNFDPFVVYANYAGTVPGLARIDIVVKTTTGGAYAYIADLDNGSNLLTSFQIWSNGLPSVLMPETLGDAVAMWSVGSNSLTASGSIGAYLKNALTTGKFLALK